MADPSRYPNALDDKGGESGQESSPRTPRWVKLFGIVILLLILAFLIVKLVGVGGNHGPDRHSSSDSIGDFAVITSELDAVEVSTTDTEALGSGRATALAGQQVWFVLPWVGASGPIDHLTHQVARTVQT